MHEIQESLSPELFKMFDELEEAYRASCALNGKDPSNTQYLRTYLWCMHVDIIQRLQKLEEKTK